MDKMAEELRQRYAEMSAEDLLYLRAQGTLTNTASTVLADVLRAKGIDALEAETIEAGFRQEVEKKRAIKEVLASIPSRFTAKVIDLIVAFFLAGILSIAFESLFPEHKQTVSGVSVLAFLLFLLFKDSAGGQSIGKRIVKVKVVRTDNGNACSWGRSFLRNITMPLGIIDNIFALGSESRRLGDLIAGTRVVRVSTKR